MSSCSDRPRAGCRSHHGRAASGRLPGRRTGRRSALFYETIERARLGLPLYGPILDGARQWLPGRITTRRTSMSPSLPSPRGRSGRILSWRLAGLIAGLYLRKGWFRPLASASWRAARCSADVWLRGMHRSGHVANRSAVASASRARNAGLDCVSGRQACARRMVDRVGSERQAVPPCCRRELLSLSALGAAVATTLAGLGAATVGVVVFGTENFLTWLAVFEAANGLNISTMRRFLICRAFGHRVCYLARAAAATVPRRQSLCGHRGRSRLGGRLTSGARSASASPDLPRLLSDAAAGCARGETHPPGLSWAWVALRPAATDTPGSALASPVIGNDDRRRILAPIFLWVGHRPT